MLIDPIVKLYKHSRLLHPSQFIIHKLTTAQTHSIIILLDSGLSGVQISKETGFSTATISCIRSQYCLNLPKSSGGCPSKLTTANITYASHLTYSYWEG